MYICISYSNIGDICYDNKSNNKRKKEKKSRKRKKTADKKIKVRSCMGKNGAKQFGDN